MNQALVLLLAIGAQAAPWAPMSSNGSYGSGATATGAYSSPAASTTTLSPAASSAAAAAASAAAADAALTAKLLTDATQVERFNDLLTVDGLGKELLDEPALNDRIVFDFAAKAAAAPGSTGGEVAQANAASFPILTDFPIAVVTAFLGPCGMNTPHVHPRATEFLTLVSGQLKSGFVLENGFLPTPQQVSATLMPFQGTVYPMGSIHFQFNPTCDNSTFVSALTSNDPGTSQIAQNFFALDAEVVGSALGLPATIGIDNLEQFRNQIPANLAREIEICAAQCHL